MIHKTSFNVKLKLTLLLGFCLSLYACNNDLGIFKYQITYHADGGTHDNPDGYSSLDEPIPLSDAVKEGAIFLGWFDNINFDGEALSELSVEMLGENIELWANFNNPHTLTLEDIDFDAETGTISNYQSTYTNIVIPESFTINDEDLTITTIGSNTFFQKQLVKVVLPNTITSIGYKAFRSNRITEVIIPESVNSIAEEAFRANAITLLTLPGKDIAIGTRAFAYNKMGTLTLPEGIVGIGIRAFEFNELTEVVLPSTMRLIDDYAFYSNTNLPQVNLPLTSENDNTLVWTDEDGTEFTVITNYMHSQLTGTEQ